MISRDSLGRDTSPSLGLCEVGSHVVVVLSKF